MLSTFPLALTADAKECKEQGYSNCGPEVYRKGDGTSFARRSGERGGGRAARGASDAATRAGERASDADGARRQRCARVAEPARSGATALSGWGRLDVAEALGALGGDELPPRDRFEPNDDAGEQAQELWGQIKRIEATLDFWDDQNDVYAIKLRRGQPVYLSVRGPTGTDTNLILWGPGTRAVDDLDSLALRGEAQSARPGPRDYLSYRAPKSGWYYVQVKLGSAGSGRYKLRSSRPENRAHWFSSSSSSGTSRSTRAGLPTTSARGGTSFVTTAPAPTNASSPISTPGQRIAPPPIRAPRRIVGPLTSRSASRCGPCSCRSSSRRTAR